MTRLVVLGDVLLDRDVEGSVERVCPDSPAPVVDVREVRERPGGAGLAALLAAQDDLDVDLATALADDPAGRAVRAALPARVRVHALLPAGPTVGKTRVRAGGQCLVRLDDAGHLLGGPERQTTGGPIDVERLDSLLLGCDAVLVADYGGGVTAHADLRAALERHAGRVPVVWDPHPRGTDPVAGTRVVTPNAGEARAQLGRGASPEVAAPALRKRWGAMGVAVTDGAAGVVVVDGPASEPVRVRAAACPPGTDTCGAGDRFAVALATALTGGADLVEAAQEAAHVVTGWLAAGGVSTRRPAERGSAAEDVVAAVRQRGGTVVAAGGCFDVLHAGHLELLRAARSQGDCLVVLVNSDEGVRRLKGPDRPVNPAADRVRLLEALEVVDAVTVFEDATPAATLDQLRPDVWVKGGDYRARDLPETPVVEAYGGRVHVVPLLAGRSTTALLARAAGRPG